MIGSGSAVADRTKESLIVESEGCWFIQVLVPCELNVWMGMGSIETVKTNDRLGGILGVNGRK